MTDNDRYPTVQGCPTDGQYWRFYVQSCMDPRWPDGWTWLHGRVDPGWVPGGYPWVVCTPPVGARYLYTLGTPTLASIQHAGQRYPYSHCHAQATLAQNVISDMRDMRTCDVVYRRCAMSAGRWMAEPSAIHRWTPSWRGCGRAADVVMRLREPRLARSHQPERGGWT